jgi:hypothetical protein
MMVDDYLGRANAPSTAVLPPPAPGRRRVPRVHRTGHRHRAQADGAIAEDVDAHYQLGAAVGLRASSWPRSRAA